MVGYDSNIIYAFYSNSPKYSFKYLWDCGIVGLKSFPSNLANLRFFTPNPFSENENWTFINVQF
jgi:hypothetical protein